MHRASRTASQGGLVLVSVVFVLGLVGLATGGTLWLLRAELWTLGRARSQLQAAYTAEAGVRHGLALLAPDVDWIALVERDPVALASAGDPGPWPIGSGGWVAFPGPPFGYALEIVSAIDPRSSGPVFVRSSATAVRGAVAVTVASVSRDAVPYLPAALVLSGGGLEVEAAATGTAQDPRVELIGAEGAASLGTPGESELAEALERAESAGFLLDGVATSGVRPFDIERFARRSALEEASVDVFEVEHGTPNAPAALRLRGGSVSRLRGVGVVLVSGDLEVVGEVEWRGAIVVGGRLRMGEGPCRVDGIVWSRGVAFAGGCVVVADHSALELADRALRLPRLPVLTGLVSE